MSKFKQFRNLTDSTSVIAEGENLLGLILKGFRLKKHDSFDRHWGEIKVHSLQKTIKSNITVIS